MCVNVYCKFNVILKSAVCSLLSVRYRAIEITAILIFVLLTQEIDRTFCFNVCKASAERKNTSVFLYSKHSSALSWVGSETPLCSRASFAREREHLFTKQTKGHIPCLQVFITKHAKKISKYKKVQTNAYLTWTHSMHIFGEIPFIKPQNDT